MTEAAPRPAPLVAIPVRHWGRWASGVLVLLGLAFLVVSFARGDVHWSTTRHYLTVGSIVRGAGRTLLISVCAQALGIALGIVVAVMRQSGNPVTGAVGWLYVWFFRGTPVILQLLLWFNLALVFPTILGHRTIDVMTPFVAALLGLGINEGAYMAEIVRGGINAVDEGQVEAGQSLGMTRILVMRRIVLPQAMRVIIPPTGNEFINMLKTSALAYVIQYQELMRASISVYTSNLQVIELLFTAAIWYLLLTSVFSVGQFYLERRYARGSAHELPPTPWQRLRANLSIGPRL